MGISGVIRCPSCDYKTSARLGMGEEELWGQYELLAIQELRNEHPNHKGKSEWQFLKGSQWASVEASYYGRH